ncbi:MAG: toll/interleukin-1 receptor domain-containing protein [Desulfobacterales bacterium]|nr:toll/interleukin-1 receptor domain-containing protein [Desulfobacterales bacterium]
MSEGKCAVSKKPIIFVSYDTEELELADFIKGVLLRWTSNQCEIFVAKRDIQPGDNPLKEMMERALKNAEAIIPICSVRSKTSPWLWWESASVWVRDKKVYPLFVNISANDFGPPLTLITQGKLYFDADEFGETLNSVCRLLKISKPELELTGDEKSKYQTLSEEYSNTRSKAHIVVHYKKLKIASELHKCSLIFEVENNTSKKYEDLSVEIEFPKEFIEKEQLSLPSWQKLYSRSGVPADDRRYVKYVFGGSQDSATPEYSNALFPGNRLRVLGEQGALCKLHYEMDEGRWENRFKYEVRWKVFINGEKPLKGQVLLDSLQCF